MRIVADREGYGCRDLNRDLRTIISVMIILCVSLLNGVSPSLVGAQSPQTAFDKFALWIDGPHLRGANIWQRRVHFALDGPDFMGPGPVGPPYTPEDFHQLAAVGANYVNISHPGLFTEMPPYTWDQEIQDHLDNLLDMIAEADMFAVISFRTGPGRSEFTFVTDGVGDWFDESYLNDAMWQDRTAQDAWLTMWRHTAEHYRDHPIVVGYDLMVEPNSNDVGSDAIKDPIGLWEADEFYADYIGTLYDWNQLYPHIPAAIREVDNNTPILIGGNGYSGVAWLPYLQPTDDSRTVYMVHQYEPQDGYTHQEPPLIHTYPGMFDTDDDGTVDGFNRIWLDNLLGTVDRFVATHGVPVAVNEFGLMRWEPGAAEFMDDEMDLFERRGMNHALWDWGVSWKPFAEEVNEFDFRFGPDPDNHTDVDSSDLIEVIKKYWSRNTIRPSNIMPVERADLLSVESWVYWLQAADIGQLVQAPYDLMVIDYSSDGTDEGAYTAQEIQRVRNSGKTVLAYLSIGEAEDYRFYWEENWRDGNPAFVGAENPDWEGNYKVKYWTEDWWPTVLQPYLDRIISAGFDGVYLDIIDAYDYWGQTGTGLEQRANQMIQLVEQIAAYGRTRLDGSFIVCPQNGLSILDDASTSWRDRYLSTIDCVGLEDLFFNIWSEADQRYRLALTDQVAGAGKPIFNVEYIRPDLHETYLNLIQNAPVEIIGYPADPDRALDELIIFSNGPPVLPSTPWDVNDDGVINVFDLVLVGGQFGKTGSGLSGDVNSDGTVNVFDLVRVASHFGEKAVGAAPPGIDGAVTQSPERVRHALAELEAMAERPHGVVIAIEFLRAWLAKPPVTETRLFPNYPNPFNPETWIPYQLATDAEVQVRIYDISGTVVRRLGIGHQQAGYYINREHAAHWNGRDKNGEPVSSGLYFYQLHAGESTETKRMVILK